MLLNSWIRIVEQSHHIDIVQRIKSMQRPGGVQPGQRGNSWLSFLDPRQ